MATQGVSSFSTLCTTEETELCPPSPIPPHCNSKAFPLPLLDFWYHPDKSLTAPFRSANLFSEPISRVSISVPMSTTAIPPGKRLFLVFRPWNHLRQFVSCTVLLFWEKSVCVCVLLGLTKLLPYVFSHPSAALLWLYLRCSCKAFLLFLLCTSKQQKGIHVKRAQKWGKGDRFPSCGCTEGKL